jgi:hypothetical protein
MRIDGIRESHLADHRGISDGLQLHMAAVFCTLQLYYNQMRLLIQAQEVNAPRGVFPIGELFCEDKCIWRNDTDVCAKYALEILPLPYIL